MTDSNAALRLLKTLAEDARTRRVAPDLTLLYFHHKSAFAAGFARTHLPGSAEAAADIQLGPPNGAASVYRSATGSLEGLKRMASYDGALTDHQVSWVRDASPDEVRFVVMNEHDGCFVCGAPLEGPVVIFGPVPSEGGS